MQTLKLKTLSLLNKTKLNEQNKRKKVAHYFIIVNLYVKFVNS